ncbi:Uncharacterised protein [Mycobacteroides abscessus subsp. abscessus]|nr:Uncharacterised protein [Mycobacteroides abscessus subsp. abscessus]
MSSSPGTQLIIETLWRRINSTHVVASARCAASTATTAAPTENMPKMSYTDKSNSRADSPSARSEVTTSNSSFKASIVFIAAACETSTPFGVPVEPDVKRTYAICEASGSTGSRSGSGY